MKASTYSAGAFFLSTLPLASAFANTSPFLLFSTEPIPSSLRHQRDLTVSTSEDFLNSARQVIKQCTSDAYIIVSQPGIHEADLTSTQQVPRLRKHMRQNEERSISIANGMGHVDTTEIEKMATDDCGAHVISVDATTGSFQTLDDVMSPKVVKVEFPRLSDEVQARTEQLSDNDAFLFALIDMLPTSKYTVVYTSTPVENIQVLHQRPNDLKKRQESASSPSYYINQGIHPSSNSTSKLGLFEKYQFFTTGIYLGIMALIILLSILYVALTAISSLQVSYGSFEKEMGPTEQKKQQ